MRRVEVRMHQTLAGWLIEENRGGRYRFEYADGYSGSPVSLAMPVEQRVFLFDEFPPFFDGLLPEGIQLEGLLRIHKLDEDDFLGQLLAVGRDLVGAVTVGEAAW